MATKSKAAKRSVRHTRIRARVKGTATRPRLAVFKSNRYVYAQLIDDTTSTTLAAIDSRTLKTGAPLERAKEVGVALAKRAGELKITEAVFDRGGFRYQGIVAALADGARSGGLAF